MAINFYSDIHLAANKIGRDADNLLDFSTDNEITFRVGAGNGVVFKASGEIEATSLDISGDADIDGTLETDALTIGGVTLAETIADTVGAMVTSNTETGITVAYQDADNTLDFTIGTLNQDTSGTAAIATAVTVADESSDTSCNVLFVTAATGDLPPKSGTNLTFNSSSGLLTATSFAGDLTGDVTGQADTVATIAGLAPDTATTQATQGAITSAANLATVGTITSGTWQGTTIAVNQGGTGVTSMTSLKNALDDETWTFANNVTLAGFVLDGNTITGVDDSSEFTDDDAHIMTSAAINDRFAQINADTTGTATVATTVTVTDNESAAEENLITFVAGAADSTGNHGLEMDGNLTYNPSNGGLAATRFTGDLVGTATVATTVTITDNESTNEENAVIFTAGGDVDGGNLGLESDGDLTYNPSTGTISATIFKGNIDAVDGDFDGTLEADVITIGGTDIGEIYSPIAGGEGIVATGTIAEGVWQGTPITKAYLNADQGNITTVGTIGSGTWQGTAIASAYLDSDTAHLSGTQTFSGAKTFSATTTTFTSATADSPTVKILNTTDDAQACRFVMEKDRGAATNGDNIGEIEFFSKDAGDNSQMYGKILVEIDEATHGQESGAMELRVASHDGEQQPGLKITGGSVEDEVDAVLGNGTTSTTTVAGALTVTSKATIPIRKFTPTGSNTAGTVTGGDIGYFGSATVVAGKIYHYKSDGSWELSDPNSAATSDGLLGVALDGGTASDVGMLLRGMVTIDHDPGAIGDLLYLAADSTGTATSTAPSGSGDIVRTIGYQVNHASNGEIWFNPSTDYITLA